MKYAVLTLLIPALLWAQDLEFQLEPDAFPVEIEGWQPFQPWAGGVNPSTPELCDIDGDGDLDYFSGSYQNYYWFFMNNGTSANPDFQYVSSTFDSIYPVCPGAAYESDIDFCDIDADGDFDAVLCNGCLGVAINQGTLLQRDFSSLPDTLFDIFGDYLWASNVAAADIDSDGDYDLFGGTWYSGELRFFKNIGTPQNYQFELITESWQGVQVSGGKADPCFADLDSDGDFDLLVGTGSGTIYYYRNDGDSANPQMTYVTDNYFNIEVQEDASPELADIDSDGDLDLFVGRSPYEGQSVTQGNVYFYENIGTPQNPFFRYITSNCIIWDCGHHATPRLVDIDADGDPDLFSHIGSRLLLYRNQGSVNNPLFVFESDNFGGVEVFDLLPWFCDVDADGDYDLFAGTGAIPGPPGLKLFLNTGTPQVPEFTLYSEDLVPGVFTQNTVVIVPSTADIDTDGDQDLFVSGSDDLYYFFENVGTPTQFQFQLNTSSWQGVSPTYGHQYHCFYDIDDDSDLDLFISSGSDYLHPWDKNLIFYRNVGTAQNASMVLESEDLFPELMIWQAAPYLLDMDQDSDGDLFVGDHWGGIRFFRNVTGEPAVRPKVVSPYRGPVLTLGPDPANPVTWVTFNLPAPQKATLAVYNLLGRKVAILAQGLQPAGTNTYLWNASQFSSGVYIIRLETEKDAQVGKVVVMR